MPSFDAISNTPISALPASGGVVVTGNFTCSGDSTASFKSISNFTCSGDSTATFGNYSNFTLSGDSTASFKSISNFTCSGDSTATFYQLSAFTANGDSTAVFTVIAQVDKGPQSTTWNVLTTKLRSSQVVAEIFVANNPNYLISELVAEVLANDIAKAVSSQIVIEVLGQYPTQVDAGPQSTTWNVRAVVNKTPSTTWNVHVVTTLVDLGPQSTTWIVRAVVNRARSTTWEYVGHGSKQTSTTWNVISVLPQLANVELWLQADKGITVGTINDVSNWADQSSHARDGTQTSTFGRPVEISNALNGLPVLRFNGTSDFMSVSNSTYMVNFGNWTFIALVKDSRTNPGQRQIISNTALDAQEVAIYLGTVGQSPTRAVLTDDFGGSSDSQGFTTGQGTLDITATNENGYFILIGETTAAYGNPLIYEGDSLVVAGDPAHYQLISRDYSKPYYIGRRGYSSQNYWMGDIAEIIVYSIELGETDRNLVVSYLKQKWFGEFRVNKSESATWNVGAPTTVDIGPRSTTWNTYKLPGLITTAIWNVAAHPPTQVDKGPQSTTWNVRQLVSPTRATTWNVIHRPITDITISTTWNVLHRPITDKTISTTWNIYLPVVTAPTNTIWNIYRVRTKNRTVLWNDHININTSRVTTWNVSGGVTKTASTTWNVRRLADKIAFPRVVERSRWNALNNGNTLTTNIQQYAEWDVHYDVDAIHSSSWNVDVLTNKNSVAMWNTHVLVNKSRSMTWNDRALVDTTRFTDWFTLPLSYEKQTFWNVCVKVLISRHTTWQNIKDNNSGAYTYWNDCVVTDKGPQNTAWNVHVPVGISKVTTWNISSHVDASSPPPKGKTKWNVIRAKQFKRTTYWNTIYGKSLCTLIANTAKIYVRKDVRWNVIHSGNNVSRVIRWNDNAVAAGLLQPMTEWRVLHVESRQNNTIWRVQKFTTSITISTSWSVAMLGNRQRVVDWNVFHLQIGSLIRSTMWTTKLLVNKNVATTWNVHQIAARPSSWNVRTLVGKTASTTWAIGVKSTKNTTWNVHTTVGKSINTNYNVRLLSGSEIASTTYKVLKLANTPRGVSWNDHILATVSPHAASWKLLHLANQVKETSWDYSVVKISHGSTWNDISIVPANVKGTLWNIFQDCSAEFVEGDPCRPGHPGCPSTALLPKITVCELENDRIKKKYKSKYDKSYKQIRRSR